MNTLKDALQAAQIRELLRAARNGQQAEGVNRTQKILLAYNVFMRHYQEFADDEKEMMTFFGLTPLLDLAFWSALIDGEQAVSRKLMADVDVGAYNVIFVMPKLRELLTRENDRDQLIVADATGGDQEIKRLRLLVAERERSLTDPHIIINVMRSLDEFYEGMAALRGGDNTGLTVGSIDSGSTKSFDFFGAAAIMDEISELLIAVWDRIKYSAEDNFRYQIEVAMMAAGFINRVKDAQTGGRISEEQGQRITRSVAKAIETLFRSGAFTEEMDAVREVRASQFLVPKTQLLEYRREEARVEFKSIEMRDGLDADKVEPLTRVHDGKDQLAAGEAPVVGPANLKMQHAAVPAPASDTSDAA
ncbi:MULTISPECIES: hypothetical protein [Rhodomicrobium]|uniref:hypothetical protein n=1 Tax=Rhodomicrobium TaxID=1068 RepID=UPI000B4B7984|nr:MULTISPECIES: hypothetical protein [Rhodomicrobium]